MDAITIPDFTVDDDIRTLALQGNWGVRIRYGPEGGRFVVAERERATQACLAFVDRVRTSNAHVAFTPELSIPYEAVAPIIDAVRSIQRSVAFIGGIEGLTRLEYESIAGTNGTSQPLTDGTTDGYVNPMLIVVKTATRFVVRVRAKRVPSRAENQHGPPMATGAGPFTILTLGPTPFIIVPLICAEFVWPEGLWARLEAEVATNIDIVPVLQRNDDLDARHTSPALNRAYTQGGKTARARFVFINQAVGDCCDGTCYVVVPPTSPADPAFDHSTNELWHLPGVRNYRGFRIPDRTGCLWSAVVSHPGAAASALGNRACEGQVTEVLSPAGEPLRGLSAGLLRSTAIAHRIRLTPTIARIPEGGQRSAAHEVIEALDRDANRYLLRQLTTAAANNIVFQTRCNEWPLWSTVEGVISELVEAGALLAAGSDPVQLTPCPGGNCQIAGKPLAILYAPDVDSALTAHFTTERLFDGSALPAGIVLLGVVSGPSTVGARRVGDVLRADRVTSRSSELTGIPAETNASAVTIRPDDVDFWPILHLRPNLVQHTPAAARERIQSLFPAVYA